MKVINKEYKFSFEIPDGYEEICRDDYPKYRFDPSTLNILVKSEGPIPHTVSLNRDVEVKDEDDYVSLVLLNIENMGKMGLIVTSHLHHTSNNRRIDIIYSRIKLIRYVTYMTTIRNMVVACSTEIKEINDENDQTIEKMFDSIKELEWNIFFNKF